MSYGMWLLSTGIDAYFARQALPDQYTVHNITVTIRTVTLGLSYLATFIFGVNAIGLFGAACTAPCQHSCSCEAVSMLSLGISSGLHALVRKRDC